MEIYWQEKNILLLNTDLIFFEKIKINVMLKLYSSLSTNYYSNKLLNSISYVVNLIKF